jgi:glycosyltransferase involved in cell wall biosynthesis
MAQEAKELGLTRNDVIFLGACDNVPALLTQCGFLVLCSDYEGFPNVVLEAMAASLPVISTPVGDAERIVREDQTGYMVDLDDTDSMAERMVELANSPLTRRRLGAEGRRCVEQEFDYETLLVRLLSVFHDFAGQNRRHRLMRRLEAWLAGPGIDTPIPRYRQPALAQHV